MSSREESLWKELECPACLEIVKPPIFMCNNAHNICKSCNEKAGQCPLCRGTLTNTRNIALEAVVKNIPLPCSHKDFGCTCTMLLDQLAEHKASCIFRPISCWFKECEAVFQREAYFDHMQSNHATHSIELQLLESNSMASSWELVNTDVYFILESGVYTFFYYQRRNPTYLSCCIQFISGDVGADMFEYKLDIRKGNKNLYSFSGKMDDITVSDNELQDEGSFLLVPGEIEGDSDVTIIIKKKDN